MMSKLRTFSGRITAGAIAATLFAIAFLPGLAVPHIEDLDNRFVLRPSEIPAFGDISGRRVRDVHPEYRHITGWISSVGAGVALSDLDGDGLPNDMCLVDPRNDSVTLAPVAGTRFAPIRLDAEPTRGGPPIAPMGCILADANADGVQDAIVYYWGRAPIIFEHSGGMRADAFTAHEIAPGEVWYSNAAVFADLDGDGFEDLMIGNYFPDDSGVLDVSGSRPVTMHHSMSRAGNAGINRLFLNHGARRGQVAFKDHSAPLTPPMVNGWTLAMGAADLNDDGLLDIYVANDFGPDRLLLNRSRIGAPEFEIAKGRRSFLDTRSSVLGDDSFKGMGVEFADIDADDDLDIYVSNIAEDYALHESHFLFVRQAEGFAGGHAPFKNRSGALGLARSSWSWDAKLIDLDNDGELEAVQATGFAKGGHDRWPELHELAMGNDEFLRFPGVWPRFGAEDSLSGDRHDAIFIRDSDGVFHDMAVALGLGGASISRGIAVADIDADGDLDFVIARQWEPSVFVENAQTSARQFLNIDLRISNPNGTSRPLIGATVTAELPDGRRIRAVSDISNGHSGHRAAAVHFGLGASPPDRVRVAVTWRDDTGLRQRQFGLQPGHHRIILDRADTARATPAHPPFFAEDNL